ncbi:transcriptional activator [Deinococcus yavapaiensis KR-236]|uniref:Transcriptional activator n=1 Tax=Deinococcus yavapaiensis KR-236 TaxID=694435 RepID=A0A318S2J9_9DEIO|nr:transcriptional activator [Deinococcus yavapaiensis KR-236]
MPIFLERKGAAVVAYLALTGSASRSKLAGMLWPDAREATARNNLAQQLRKLRLALEDSLVQGSGVLSLDATVTVDVLEARVACEQGRHEAFVDFQGTLLGDLAFDDCPDFDAWLTAERTRLAQDRGVSLRALASAAEASGDTDATFSWASRLLEAEPLAEDAYVRVMTLQYLRGDVAAARATYERCEAMLAREFGAAPLAETVAFAAKLKQPKQTTARRSASAATLSIRAPALVGREREWARMQEAWDKGQFIFLSGESGVGKSRLAREFAANQGAFDVFAGRPGDVYVPFAANTRRYRELLARNPDLRLEPWMRAELGRVLPELSDDAPPPVRTDEDRERFFFAQGELIRFGSEGLKATVIDDLQYFDQASIDVGDYAMIKYAPLGKPGGLPRFIDCFRRGELPPSTAAAIQYGVELGLACVIELEPLAEDAAIELVLHLGVDAARNRAREVARATGGNPQFILETVRQLAHRPSGAPLTLPETVGQAIERRLRELTPGALLTLRAASVLQRDFDVDLVADVLHSPLLDVVGHWEELEAGQFVRGERFTHDLILETTRANLPLSVAHALHRSAAAALTARGAESARVARHWLEGGVPSEAAEAFVRAAARAEQGGRWREAAELLVQAALSFEADGHSERAAEQWADAARFAHHHHLELVGSLEPLGSRTSAVDREAPTP